MPRFRYRALDRSGVAVAGEAEAMDQAAAAAQLQMQGLLPIEVADAGGGFPPPQAVARSLAQQRRRPGFARFVRQLATLVRAGVPLDRSLALIADLDRRGRFGLLASRLGARVRGGDALSAALAAEATGDGVSIALVVAGEASGRLDETLERLAGLLEREATLADSVRSALVYPVTLLVAALATVLILVTMVLPQFALMFERAGQPVPALTRLLLDTGILLQQAAPGLVAAVVLVWLGVRLAGRRPEARLVLDRLAYRVPLFGPLAVKTAAERLLRLLGGLAAGGVALPKALDLAAEASDTLALARIMDEVATRVREGRSLGDAFAGSGWMPPLAVELIRIGEATGRLDTILVQAADIYEQEVRTTTARLVALLTPTLTIALGVVVGTIVLVLMSSVVELYAIVG